MAYRDLIAGLDIGTSNIKLSVFTPEGSPAFEEAVLYQTYYPQPGWAEQSPDDWISGTRHLLGRLARSLGSQRERIAALGLSAHAPSLVFLSKSDESLFDRVPIWSDERSASAVKRLVEVVGDDFVGLGMPSSSFAAKLYWFATNYVLRDIAFLVGIKGYVARWLTGVLATDSSSEPGNETRWGKLMDACGFRTGNLPPVYDPTSSIGLIRKGICDEIGLPQNIPVIIGLNDGGSSALSSGACRAGDTVIELATNGVVYHVTANPISSTSCLDKALFCWKFIEDLWIDGGQTRFGAAAFQWAAKACGVDEPLDLDTVMELARESSPGSKGLMFFPYLAGQGTPRDDPSVRGTLFGLAMTTRHSDFYRSVVEGVSYSIKEIVDTLKESGLPINRVFISGGGSRSGFCRQTVADVLNSPLLWARTDATLGAAILASVSVGLHATVEEAVAALVPSQNETTPDQEARREYDKLASRYFHVRDEISELYSTVNN